MDNKIGLSCRQFVSFDNKTDLGFIVYILDKKGKKHKCRFVVMVHPCSDDPNGVIHWFDLEEI